MKKHLLAACGAAALALAGALAPTPAQAALTPGAPHYYVDPSRGSDSNPGTLTKPWKSYDPIYSHTLTPGSHVSLKRGTTLVTHMWLDDSGTQASPVTFDAYGSGAAPIITSGSNSRDTCFDVHADYNVFSGLHAVHCGEAFTLYGAYDTVTGSEANDNITAVVAATGSYGAWITNNKFHDNNAMWVDTPGGNDDSGAFNVLLNGERALVTDNKIWNCSAHSYDYGRDGSAVEIYESSNNRILRNQVTNCNAYLELGGATSNNNLSAFNTVLNTNASIAPNSYGIVQHSDPNNFGPVSGTWSVNDTIVTNTGGSAVACDGDCSVALNISNDILSTKGNQNTVWGNPRVNRTLYYGPMDGSTLVNGSQALPAPLTSVAMPPQAKGAGVPEDVSSTDVYGKAVTNPVSIGAVQ